MRIGLLASQSGVYSYGRFKEAAEARGHEFVTISLQECFVNISSTKHGVMGPDGKPITGLDAVIPRIVPDLTFFGTAVLRQFELQGVYPVNNSLAIIRAQDKLRTLQIFAKHKIPMPTTGFAHSPKNTEAVIQSVGGAPLVVKLIEGMEGMGVVLAETKSAAVSVVNAFKGLKADILVQQFVKESTGRDIRCYVVGDKVVASMERVAKGDEFRANVALGADVRAIQITKREERLAIKAAKAVGLDVAGVDILRSDKGPLIIEINSCAGLKGIETATGVDVAGHIIDFLVANAKPYKSKNTA
jgi:ribosomal protein S6--L-glutamate ligase